MHTGTLKKLALALTFWLALHASSLKAQLLGPFGSDSTVFEVDANGLLSSTGTTGGTLSLSGAGTRMFWFPGKAAFRAGSVSGTQWDAANVAFYSVAMGQNTIASGFDSTAFGISTTASSNAAFAAGNATVASSFGSIALGNLTVASGGESMATGTNTIASGLATTAMGGYTTASGYYATALGVVTVASGNYSTASGYYTTAAALSSFAVGQWNVGNGNRSTWVPTDPLFEVGNGASATAKADALVVYKNGNSQVHGTFRCAAGGDISMGSFTAGTHP